MNVAWQFTAWKQLKKRSVPLGHGMIVVRRSGHARRMVTEATSNEIIPSLRDGLFFGVIPGSKLPGLRSSSPSGTKTLRALLADTVPRSGDDLCLCSSMFQVQCHYILKAL